jgi:hypothetical protein
MTYFFNLENSTFLSGNQNRVDVYGTNDLRTYSVKIIYTDLSFNTTNMSANAYIKALKKMIAANPSLEAENALYALDDSDMMYREFIEKCEEYAVKCKLGAKLVNAVNVICYPESDDYEIDDYEIDEAKTILEDNAAKTAQIAEQFKNDADRRKLAEIRSTYDEHRLQTAIADAESTKAEAEEAAMFAAIGSLDKVEADKLKARVNEIAEGYHEKFTFAVQNCATYREAFTKAMATAEVLVLNA